MLFLLPLIFWYQATDLFGAPKIALLRVVSLLLLAALAVRWALKGSFVRPAGWAWWAAAGFLLLVALSTLFSVHPATSFLGLNKRFFGLTTYAAFFILFWVAASRTWGEGQLRVLFSVSIAAAALSSLLGLLQVAGVYYPLDLSGIFPDRAYAAIGNPNFLGVFLGMNLPLALGLLHRERGPTKLLSGLAVVILVTGLAATRSTGALAAASGAVLIFYLVYFRGRFSLGGSRAVFAAAGLVLLPALAGALLIQSEGASLAGRLQTWQGVSSLVVGRPLLGVGPDAVRLAVASHLPAVKGHHNEIPEDGHNLFLTLAATVGLPALGLYILFLALLTRELLGARRTGDSPPWAAAAIAALGAGYVAGQMVNPDDLAPAALFWAAAGVAASLGSGVRLSKGGPEKRTAADNPSAALLTRWAASGLIVVVCLAPAIAAFRPFMAEVYLYRAENTADIAAAVPIYEAASRANPFYDRYPLREAERLWSYVQRDDDWMAGAALNSAREAIARSPLEADNYTILGSLYRVLGDSNRKPAHYQEAIRQYKKALTLSPYQLFAIKGLALVYRQLGNPREGLRWTARYLQLADDPEVSSLHAELLKQADTLR